MESEDAEYGMVMSFWIDTNRYSDRDREMFVCGVEFQMVYETIKDKRDWSQCIHTENESRIRMICGRLGLPVKMVRHCGTWTHCEILASTTI